MYWQAEHKLVCEELEKWELDTVKIHVGWDKQVSMQN